MHGGVRRPSHDPGTLFRVSEQFLRRRHFDDCRRYAHQAHQIDPNFPGVSQILAVADVLLVSKRRISTETLTDWYAIMQLNRYTHDADLIRQRFNHLYGLLNPTNNKLPFADEAFDLVCDAWYVLSNPLKRFEFDGSLKKLLDDGNSDRAFWTVCPYCYYVYEYPRVYLELCLRCPNEKCWKAFTCVEIDRPPVDVLREGKYKCAGFMPAGIRDGSWNPFAPSEKQKVNTNSNNNPINVVEIPDDDDDEVETKSHKPHNVSSEGVHEGSSSVKMGCNIPTTKLDVRRKKSVAKNIKKVTGAGNRVTIEDFVQWEETNRTGPSTDNDDDGCEIEFSSGDVEEPMNPLNIGEVEFYEADDDILVSLSNDI